MEELLVYPYNFQAHHTLVARITPRNMIGSGLPSHTCPSDVTIDDRCNHLPDTVSGFRIKTTRSVGIRAP
jgi:hypothetical protein